MDKHWCFICVRGDQILNKLQAQRHLQTLPEHTILFVSPQPCYEIIVKARPCCIIPSTLLDPKTKSADLRAEVARQLRAHSSGSSYCFVGPPRLANIFAEHEGFRGTITWGLWSPRVGQGQFILSVVELPKVDIEYSLAQSFRTSGGLKENASFASLETSSCQSQQASPEAQSDTTPRSFKRPGELEDQTLQIFQQPEYPLQIESVSLIANEYYSVQVANLTNKPLEDLEVRSGYTVLASFKVIEAHTKIVVRATIPRQLFLSHQVLRLGVYRGNQLVSNRFELPLCTLSFRTGSDKLHLRNNCNAAFAADLQLGTNLRVVSVEPAAVTSVHCNDERHAVAYIGGTRASNYLRS